MGRCEICGRETRVRKVDMEGARIEACFGCVAGAPKKRPAFRGRRGGGKPRMPRIERVLMDDYSKLVKQKREKLGITQEDLGKKISEPESIIHKIESGSFRPPFRMIRKLERELKVRLTKRADEEGEKEDKPKTDGKRPPKKKLVVEQKKTNDDGINAGMTIGDIIKFRR